MSFKNKIFCALDFSELEQTVQFTNSVPKPCRRD